MTIEELNKMAKAFNNGDLSCCITLDDIAIYSESDTYIIVDKYALDNVCLRLINKQSPKLIILSIYKILEYNLTIEKENWFTFYRLRKEK